MSIERTSGLFGPVYHLIPVLEALKEGLAAAGILDTLGKMFFI